MNRPLRHLEKLEFILQLCFQLREVGVGYLRRLFLEVDSLSKIWAKERLVDRGNLILQQQQNLPNTRAKGFQSAESEYSLVTRKEKAEEERNPKLCSIAHIGLHSKLHSSIGRFRSR
ncbi:hypothetical protein HN51_050404 [Arachis hypogaea]